MPVKLKENTYKTVVRPLVYADLGDGPKTWVPMRDPETRLALNEMSMLW